MAASDPHQAADPDAVKRHPALFRAIRKRQNPGSAGRTSPSPTTRRSSGP